MLGNKLLGYHLNDRWGQTWPYGRKCELQFEEYSPCRRMHNRSYCLALGASAEAHDMSWDSTGLLQSATPSTGRPKGHILFYFTLPHWQNRREWNVWSNGKGPCKLWNQCEQAPKVTNRRRGRKDAVRITHHSIETGNIRCIFATTRRMNTDTIPSTKGLIERNKWMY